MALAVCPRGTLQHYSSASANVAEVADLLGRTPGSVSMHFANFFSLRTHGEHGFSNVGALVRKVFREWDSRPVELREKASRLRAPLLTASPTPRLEKKVSELEEAQLRGSLVAWSERFQVPASECIVYSREGSIELGVVIIATYFWSHPDLAAEALSILVGIFGKDAKTSVGVWLARRQEERELADKIILKKLPDFELHHLNVANRRHLAMLLSSLNVPRIRLTKALKIRASKLQETTEIAAVRTYLNLNPSKPCRNCLALLKAVIDWITS